MIWLTWRQFRVQTLVAAIALVLIAAYLVYLGMDIRDAHDAYRARCASRPADCPSALAQFRSDHESTLLFLAAGLQLIPIVIGTFWGAPLIARELETGTHRLVWNQSVTRRRWLAVKLAFVALAGAALTGAASALLTWAARPFDETTGDRFSRIMFGARDIAPVGYAVLAFALGTVVGLLLRRTLPAMAVTGVAFIVLQFAFPNMVRPHLIAPEKATLPMTAQAINGAQNMGSITGGAVIHGLAVPGSPGAWVSGISPFRTADGRTLSGARFDECLNSPQRTGADGKFGDTAVCLARLNLHVDVAYQPKSRYWAFQGLETAAYLLLAGLLTAFGLWRIRHRVS
ncbi:ABC transporter permease subunit [Actinomadura montaniterrae]|uniref:ABC transporter permease subunit n=1 Tax=Actinomadura montaniterrae TaxID=1803903 RepID=A0A6L3VH90_9ACTN|nr:ABC transporter permease subunit [Actinomadura montaniterrae]KAB2364113.1 ABC transporter permease subunit [Actinomadura montaniterrae]